ncbi:MAG: peptide chain release factor N(5)-glutamine methyltransferase [Candidatus Abawacabacteria bacterium]|nr:peptide chain release factor N(5)-glutamine methyltransferase [Candidatus Abawacabacteria bacterium]
MFSSTNRHEIEVLIAHFLKKDRLWVLTHQDFVPPSNVINAILNSARQLISGEPLAYIVGYKRFYDVDFFVDKHVLIPRQETEELIAHVLNSLSSYPVPSLVADIGTGSGCIGLTLAHLASQHRYVLVDISEHALAVAQRNAKQLNISINLVKFQQGDLLDSFLPQTNLPKLIVANLPYLNEHIYQTLTDSVRLFEPKLALSGGPDGLDLCRKLLAHIVALYPHGAYPEMWWEISPEQKDLLLNDTIKIPHQYQIAFYQDLSARIRFVHFIPQSFHDVSDTQ